MRNINARQLEGIILSQGIVRLGSVLRARWYVLNLDMTLRHQRVPLCTSPGFWSLGCGIAQANLFVTYSAIRSNEWLVAVPAAEGGFLSRLVRVLLVLVMIVRS